MFTEDPPKLYKIEFSLELAKWFLNGRLVKMMIFFEISIEKEQIAVTKITKSRGNLLDILLGFGPQAL
jgi:hypothetical protein